MTRLQRQQFSRQELGKLLAGFFCIWFVFDRTAQLIHSTIGLCHLWMALMLVTSEMVTPLRDFAFSLPSLQVVIQRSFPWDTYVSLDGLSSRNLLNP